MRLRNRKSSIVFINGFNGFTELKNQSVQSDKSVDESITTSKKQ